MQKIAFKILMAAQWVKLGQVDIKIRKQQTRSIATVHKNQSEQFLFPFYANFSVMFILYTKHVYTNRVSCCIILLNEAMTRQSLRQTR